MRPTRPSTNTLKRTLLASSATALLAVLVTTPAAAQSVASAPPPIIAQDGGAWSLIGDFLTEFSSQLWAICFAAFLIGLMLLSGVAGTGRAVAGRTLVVGAFVFALVLLLAGDFASFFQGFGNVGEGIGGGGGAGMIGTFDMDALVNGYVDTLHTYLVGN